MEYKIIDFHTHPYLSDEYSICKYKASLQLDVSKYKAYFNSLGIQKICGSVIKGGVKYPDWQQIKALNDEALRIRDVLGDFYVPGYHISARHVDQSIKEVERMQGEGVNLIGEILPYVSGSYFEQGYKEIFSEIENKGIVLSFHSTVGEDDDKGMEELIKTYKGITFVAAHFGEYDFYMKHIKRMKECPNYYLDTSGTGLFRLGALPYGVKEVGADRFLFGSDFATCTPSMFVGGVATDPFLTEEEKKAVFYDNAKRILKL